MSLTIQGIVDTSSLSTKLMNTTANVSRAVRWAHVCELEDPTEWLGEGDLLMTTGLGIPLEPDQQKRYIERLADARLAGLMIGENMHAPLNMKALEEMAQQRGFPVLLTHYSVPFSAVMKVILEAGRKLEFERQKAVVNLYQSARIGLGGIGITALLKRLERDVSARLYLFDATDLSPWQCGLPTLPDAWCAVIGARRQIVQGMAPGVFRCTENNSDQEGRLIPLPSLEHCELLAVGGALIDYGLLHHVAGVLSIELERQHIDHAHTLTLGDELLGDLLQQRLGARVARTLFEQVRFPEDDAIVLSLNEKETPLGADSVWQDRLRRRGLRCLVRREGDDLLLLLPDSVDVASVQATLGCPVGVSRPLEYPLRMVEARNEARLALAHASARHPVISYASIQADEPWLPGSIEQARRIYRNVLGPLAEYDREHGSQLEHTLFVFLDSNRSWQKAAKEMNLHKQTLVYRIKRISDITGRSLNRTEDVTILWIAVRAGMIVADT